MKRTHEGLETYRSLQENRAKLAEAEQTKINEAVAKREDFRNNYDIIKSRKRRLDAEHGRLLEAARDEAFAKVIKGIYIGALEVGTLSDNGIMLAESMVDNWIKENGGASSILTKVGNNTYLLSRITQIVENAAIETINEIESEEEDDEEDKKATAEDKAKEFIKNANKEDIKDFVSNILDSIQKKSKDDAKEAIEKKQEKEEEKKAEAENSDDNEEVDIEIEDDEKPEEGKDESKEDSEKTEEESEESEDANKDDKDTKVEGADPDEETGVEIEDDEKPEEDKEESEDNTSESENEGESEDEDSLGSVDDDDETSEKEDEATDDTDEELGEPLDDDGIDQDISVDGDTSNDGKIFDQLDKEEDVQKAVELIRSRVADAEETFIRNNAEDKKKVDELLNKISNNVKTVEDLNDKNEAKAEVAKESARYNKMKIDSIRENRPLTVFEKMTRNLSSSIITNESVLKEYTDEDTGTLDMGAVIESARVMYGFLETVNTLQLSKVDANYIQNILDSM